MGRGREALSHTYGPSTWHWLPCARWLLHWLHVRFFYVFCICELLSTLWFYIKWLISICIDRVTEKLSETGQSDICMLARMCLELSEHSMCIDRRTIPQTQIHHLIRSMGRRFTALVQAVGGHMLLTLWTLGCDPCLIPWSAVNTQWKWQYSFAVSRNGPAF